MRIALLAFVSLLSVLDSSAQPTNGWLAAADVYAAGQGEDALNMVARLSPDEVLNGADEAFLKGKVKNLRQAEALFALWTEVQVETYQSLFDDPRRKLGIGTNRLNCRYQGVMLARNAPEFDGLKIRGGKMLFEYVREHWKLHDAVLEAWFVVVLTHYQGGGGFQSDDCLGVVPNALKRSPEMLLATARHHENVWVYGREGSEKVHVFSDLGVAEESLRAALVAQPTLDEARLRLGRVLSLRGNSDEALNNLAMVVAPMDPKFVYLARLFEAELFEQTGDLEKATAAYDQALLAYPRGQSALVGRDRIKYLRGKRIDARTAVVGWATESGKRPRDPWAEYYYGFEGQLQKYRERLRAAVVKAN